MIKDGMKIIDETIGGRGIIAKGKDYGFFKIIWDNGITSMDMPEDDVYWSSQGVIII
jgi:hypothetical protein